MAQGSVLRHEHGDDASTPGAGDISRRQLTPIEIGGGPINERRIPVEVAVGGGRHIGHELDVGLTEPAQERSGDELDRRPGVLPALGRQRDEFAMVGQVGRGRPAVAVHLSGDVGGGESEATGGERRPQDGPHRFDLGGTGLVGRSGRAHDGPPDGRVADHESDVQGQWLGFHHVEQLGERLPLVGDAGQEGFHRYGFDPGQEAGQELTISRCGRGQGETAVATHRGGDAVQRRGAQGRIPEQLRVVVGVQVDEARRHHQAVSLNGHVRLVVHRADLDDAPIDNAHVPLRAGSAAAVDHVTAVNQKIEHASPILPRQPKCI